MANDLSAQLQAKFNASAPEKEPERDTLGQLLALHLLADLAPVFAAAAAVLDREGLFAFTVQAHAGDGAVLGDDQRFAHGKAHLLALAQRFSFGPVIVESA